MENIEEKIPFNSDQESFIGLKHNLFDVIKNKRRSAKVAVEKAKSVNATVPERNLTQNFLESKVIIWIGHSIKHWFKSKENFKTYLGTNDTGVYDGKTANGEPSDNISIALTADWATNTQESMDVTNKMMSHNPDYTIHLGDTYYTGELSEINSNYIDDNAPWKKGPSGSFALMGNHEMYTSGIFYYNPLLTNLGERDFSNSNIPYSYKGQKASYFCLRTKFWNVIGLDTGYNSVSFPYLNSFRKNCEFEPGLVDWLKSDELDLKNSERGIIFLSHHQYYSAYEDEYYKPAEQLAEIIGTERKVLWIWGHEHRFSIYGKFKSKNGIPVHGRCIGHGGMPVEIDAIYKKEKDQKFDATANDRKLLITDKRIRKIVDKTPIGFNGYVILNIKNKNITITYYSIEDTSSPDSNVISSTNTLALLEETWTIDNKGSVTGIAGGAKHLVKTPDFNFEGGRWIGDEVIKEKTIEDIYL